MRVAAFVLGVSLMLTSFLAVCASLRVPAVDVGRWQIEAGVLLAVELDQSANPESRVDRCNDDRDEPDGYYDLVNGVHFSVFSWASVSIF